MNKMQYSLFAFAVLGLSAAAGPAKAQTANNSTGAKLIIPPNAASAAVQVAPLQMRTKAEPGTGFENPSNKKSGSKVLSGGARKVQATTPKGVKISSTYYDFQTNASMPDRIEYRSDDKTIEGFWMVATKDDWSDRRTRYSAVDATNPDDMQILAGGDKGAIVEGERGGFPSMVAFPLKNGDGGQVGTPSHVNVNGTNIKFHKNGSFLDEEFTAYSVVPESPADSTLWARGAVDGQGNIHVIYTYSETHSKTDQIAYRRSTDGGKTWSAEVMMTGPDALGGPMPTGIGADAYAIAARGDVVAMSYPDGTTTASGGNQNWWIRKSTDNGQTWTARMVYQTPHVNFMRLEDRGAGNIGYISDTTTYALTAGTNHDIIIDSRGFIHAVATAVPTARRGTGVSNGSEITRVADTVLQFTIYLNRGLMYYTEEDNQIFLMGPPAGGLGPNNGWDGEGQIFSRRYGQGASRYPQLGIDAGDSIYCIYTSVANSDSTKESIRLKSTTGFTDATGGLYGHIWATHTAPGRGWSAPVDITGDGVDCIFGTLANTVADGHLYLAYNADDIPGDRVTESNTDATTEYPVISSGVYMHAFPLSQLAATPERPATSVIPEGEIPGFAASAYPNPASLMATVNYTVPSEGKVSVDLFNIMGQKVFTVDGGMVGQGTYSLNLNLEHLPVGNYYYMLNWNGNSLTKKLTVVK